MQYGAVTDLAMRCSLSRFSGRSCRVPTELFQNNFISNRGGLSGKQSSNGIRSVPCVAKRRLGEVAPTYWGCCLFACYLVRSSKAFREPAIIQYPGKPFRSIFATIAHRPLLPDPFRCPYAGFSPSRVTQELHLAQATVARWVCLPPVSECTQS